MGWSRTTMNGMGSGRVDPHTEETRHMRDRVYTAMGVPMADAGPLPEYSETELTQNYPEDVERHGTQYANDQSAGVDIPHKYAGHAREIQHPDEPVQHELTETGERGAEMGAASGKARDLAERYGPDPSVTPTRLWEAKQDTTGAPDAPEIGYREIAQDVARVLAGRTGSPPRTTPRSAPGTKRRGSARRPRRALRRGRWTRRTKRSARGSRGTPTGRTPSSTKGRPDDGAAA